MRNKQPPIPVEGILLTREGDTLVVSVAIDSAWVPVIREPVRAHIYHIADPAAIHTRARLAHAAYAQESAQESARSTTPGQQGIL